MEFYRGKGGNTKQKIFYGWIIIGLSFINLGMAYGAQYSFGVLFPALLAEFKWDRHSIAGAFSLYNFIYCAVSFLLGRWSDRFGPRRILIFGSVFLGAGIGLISQVHARWHLYLIYGLLASWGMSAAYMTASPTVVKWFIEKRGLALGLCQSGLGLGIIAVPPICGALISSFGWRQACMILGAAVFVTLFTVALFLKEDPEKIGLQPDGRPSKTPGSAGGIDPYQIHREVNYSAAEAIRTRSFWIITALFFCTWLFIFVPLVHLVVFTMDIGLSQKAAFAALGALGGASTVGRLTIGFLSDHIGRRSALAINLAGQVLSWFWIMGTSTSWMLFCFALIFGFSYGAVNALFPAIVGDYFGRLQAASIIGAVFTIAGGASALGPLIAGYIYDLARSYQFAFLLGALSNFLALILVLLSHPPGQKTAI